MKAKFCSEEDSFKTLKLEPGITLRYLPTSKWKTLSISIFCKIPIVENEVTPLALVPRLAAKGTKNLPDMQSIARFLENMYGAGMHADAIKVGPVQVIRFAVDMPSPIYLENRLVSIKVKIIVEQILSFLRDLVAFPNLENGVYPEKMFNAVRDEHRRAIMGIINNRSYYATVRLTQAISLGDPRGLPVWGSLSALNTVDSANTWKIWKNILSQCPISIYVVGHGAEQVVDILAQGSSLFKSVRSNRILNISKHLEPPLLPKHVLRDEDILPGEQTILCMAFDTGLREGDPQIPAMLFCDGILGGFPHSKLFTVVREKQSLAYFADTVSNTWRGLIIAVAGISESDKTIVEELISTQVEALQKGNIAVEEIERTRRGLVRRFRAEGDSQAALIRRSLNQEILGGIPTHEQLADAISKVSKDEIVDVASRIELKAVYTLRSKGDGIG